MVDLRAQYERIRPAIDSAMARVLATTHFVNGEECARFEQEFAAFCGAGQACGVANGTDALTLALRALGIGPGDEVVTVSATFVATSEAILLAGARPVWVDVDPVTFTMAPDLIERALTPRTRVIVPVHLYGHPADMPGILDVAKRHGLPVLEDAAQGHGAGLGGRRAGAWGDAACFSFYPGKNLGAYGDAGAVVSNDAHLVARVRQLANHGAGPTTCESAAPGTNSRLDTLQAAVLRAKLPHLLRWNDERRERAEAYTVALEGLVETPRERAGARSSWHLYTIRLDHREELRARLGAAGIATGIHYPTPLHLQPAMASAGRSSGPLPVTERLFRRVLSLPLYPEMPREVVDRVAVEVRGSRRIAAAR
jgi:dTDP-4-amino-4,6-dideoxygalactose transaminase